MFATTHNWSSAWNFQLIHRLASNRNHGHWNNPGFLLSRNHLGEQLLSERQTRTQFNMYAILAAPMIISGSLFSMTAESLATWVDRTLCGAFRRQFDSITFHGKVCFPTKSLVDSAAFCSVVESIYFFLLEMPVWWCPFLKQSITVGQSVILLFSVFFPLKKYCGHCQSS